jgi:hypothetical protein
MKPETSTENPEHQPAFSAAGLLAALVQSAENRRELLMSVRGNTFDGQDRDNLQWRAQAMDDLAQVAREALEAANDRNERWKRGEAV